MKTVLAGVVSFAESTVGKVKKQTTKIEKGGTQSFRSFMEGPVPMQWTPKWALYYLLPLAKTEKKRHTYTLKHPIGTFEVSITFQVKVIADNESVEVTSFKVVCEGKEIVSMKGDDVSLNIFVPKSEYKAEVKQFSKELNLWIQELPIQTA